MKRILAIVCIAALAAGLVACGGTTPTPTEPPVPETFEIETAPSVATEAPTEEAFPEDKEILSAEGFAFAPVSGVLGAGVSGVTGNGVFDVSYVGAELFRTDYGTEAVRIWYDVKSNATWIIDAADVDLYVVQDHDPLWSVENDESALPAVHFAHSDLRPGTSVRCAAEYECDWHGGPIYAEAYYYMTFSHLLDPLVYEENADAPQPGLYDDSLIAVFQPEELPAKISVDDPTSTVANPDWLSAVTDEGTLEFDEGKVKFNGAEFFMDGEQKIVRVYMTYTNNYGSDNAFINFSSEIRVMQDGIELWKYQGENTTEEKENVSKVIADGASIEVALDFVTFSGSPVTAEYHYWADSKSICGTIYPVQ